MLLATACMMDAMTEHRFRVTLFCAIFAAILRVCAPVAAQSALPEPPAHPHGDKLWQIVGGSCLPGMRSKADPAPCAAVAKGYTLLKDMHGVAQYLLMPDEDISGIEDARILTAKVNYFAEAWNARSWTEKKLGRNIARDAISVTVNSQYGRTQDLLHLHIDCLSAETRKDLAGQSDSGTGWSKTPVTISGHPYYIRAVMGEALTVNPFQLVAAELPGARAEMRAWTIALAGATFRGKPGFWILAGRADPAHGEWGSAESLQDHDCKVPLAGG